MIAVRIKIISYDTETNTCKGQLLNGDIVDIDPFVGCAIPLTDEEYFNGYGANIVGSSYILTHYTASVDNVVPYENGMTRIYTGEAR